MAWRVAGAGIFGLGLVAGALASPARPAQAAGDAEVLQVLLAGVRNANPVVCELGLMALEGSNFSRSGIRADVEGTTPAGMEPGALAEWVNRPPRDPILVPPLRDALTGPDPCVARVAARLLGRMRSDEAVSALVATAGHADAVSRRNAALGLGLASRVETAPTLIRLLGDGDPAVRSTAAWALGEIEDRIAVPALVRTLASDPDAKARRAAAWALGRID